MPWLKLQFQSPIYKCTYSNMIYIATSVHIVKFFYIVFLVKVIIPDIRDLFIDFEKVYC